MFIIYVIEKKFSNSRLQIYFPHCNEWLDAVLYKDF